MSLQLRPGWRDGGLTYCGKFHDPIEHQYLEPRIQKPDVLTFSTAPSSAGSNGEGGKLMLVLDDGEDGDVMGRIIEGGFK